MDFESGWNEAWSDFATFLPKLLAFIVIAIIGWLVAKLLARVTNAVLERIGFDRAVERGGVRHVLAESRYDASDIAAKIVFWAVILLTLQMAFGVFGPNPVSDLLTDIISWLPQAFAALVIIVIAAALAGAVRDIVGGMLGGLSYGRILANIAAGFVLALGIIAALNQVGVATAITTPILVTVLATVGGILVVGVGGGLVRPMQQVWEGWIGTLRTETKNVTREIDLNRRTTSDATTPLPTTPTPAGTAEVSARNTYPAP